MSWRSLAELVRALERKGDLIRVTESLSDELEVAAVQQRAFRSNGPALLFERVSGSPWPALANLYATQERLEWLFRESIEGVEALIAASADPFQLLRSPRKWWPVLRTVCCALPKRVKSIPAEWREIDPNQLPGVRSWPFDGGRFWTLPQVYSEDPDAPGWRYSNLGMYRVQVSGNQFRDGKVGMHYQLQRGLGIHHQAAQRRGEPLRVSVFLGGHPAHAIAAIMPLPEGLPEIAFAGALAHRRFRYIRYNSALLSADADFILTGTVDPHELLPEGPFGDHIGYYSLQHPMPVMRIEKAWARRDAVFPFTVVARPPQEDTLFGSFIHRLTASAVPSRLPGVREVHAVDDTGVHPLLLALGSERQVPYAELKPRELLTQACSLLGFGQLSLAKVVMIADGARGDAPSAADAAPFLRHMLERVDWRRDLRILTQMPTDTLDYTGGELHGGSKMIWSVAGAPRRRLSEELPETFPLPASFGPVKLGFPGVLVVRGAAWRNKEEAIREMDQLANRLSGVELDSWPLIAVVDDVDRAASSLRNLLWTIFTRIDPASDTFGVDSFFENRHWGCRGPLLLDARIKSHHPPVVEPDPKTEERVEKLFQKGGSLYSLR